jgi:hypothetical protein
MKAFKLDWEYEHLLDMEEDASYIQTSDDDENLRFYINGIEPKETPSIIYFQANFNVISDESDYPIVDLGIPVVSKKMLKVLTDLKNFEFKEISTCMIDDTFSGKIFNEKKELLDNVPTNRKFITLQILSYTSCFDYDNSVFRPLRSNPDLPGIIKKMVLKEPDKGFPPIFRIKESSSKLFVSEEAKEALERADIKGCIFEEVEVSN